VLQDPLLSFLGIVFQVSVVGVDERRWLAGVCLGFDVVAAVVQSGHFKPVYTLILVVHIYSRKLVRVWEKIKLGWSKARADSVKLSAKERDDGEVGGMHG